MFGLLTNLTKAAVAVVATPVAIAVDIVTLPASAEDPRRGAFDNTGKMLQAVSENLEKAVDPD